MATLAGRLQTRCRQGRLAPLSWSDEFEDPIPGLRTLRDAADHIQSLPKAQKQLPHWQAAVEALIMAAEGVTCCQRMPPLLESIEQN
jgi:hypothetical protein